MCHVDEAIRGFRLGENAGARGADLTAAAAYARRLAVAAERDEGAGLAGSWRRVHAFLFGDGELLGSGLARRFEHLAASRGRPLAPRPRSAAYADEVRGFATLLGQAAV